MVEYTYMENFINNQYRDVPSKYGGNLVYLLVLFWSWIENDNTLLNYFFINKIILNESTSFPVHSHTHTKEIFPVYF